ncbi:hypothetical protein [Streptomyces scabiei]|uniref:hypothetical protein n=1 Tax=Streptomyces scabiei TaxID=1930 RepID=UPI001B301087|nr:MULTISPECIES: hypothetical protein [Streptomyces]MBP5870841.1 hypothetical protein [Streptomyces sp. LBUM 1485]MBP5913253.1 hypothetical protein [Streptomyces sp. LBUM 1486]MDX2532276.1 hypothetical protein [Streptomyces scabiei]MDX2794582.1 hypothetical protein [Streptomyces scabiei]MDX3822416.1 hypothetical protein [Streptomyces scabiei]
MARQLIELPTTFTSLPYGLWDSIQTPSPDSVHWQNGVTWEDRCPTGDTTYDECLAVTGTGAPPAPAAKTVNATEESRGATPFTVYARFDCSPVGLGDAQTVAQDALARVEQLQVEEAFWTGVAGGQAVAFPHLAADAEVLDGDVILQTAASPVVTGADVAHALGELEQELAECYAGQGLIHVPRSALATLAAWNLVEERDGALFTPGGNRIVAGGGYTGIGPNGEAPAAGTTWIYATGAAWGYRSNVYFSQVRDSLNRSSNTLQMLAERNYLIGFECCLLAAHIVLGVPTE